MARLAGVDLPRDKRVEIGLTYIYGIGLTTSKQILAETGIDPNTRVKDLTEDEFSKLVPHYTFHKNEFDYPHTDFYVNGETYDDLSFLEKLEVMPDEQ